MKITSELARRREANRLLAVRQRGIRNAETVRWIVEPLIKQGLGPSAVARTLNAYRIRTETGKAVWSPEMCRHIIARLKGQPLTPPKRDRSKKAA